MKNKLVSNIKSIWKSRLFALSILIVLLSRVAWVESDSMGVFIARSTIYNAFGGTLFYLFFMRTFRKNRQVIKDEALDFTKLMPNNTKKVNTSKKGKK